jgi:hypothetical protein
VQGGYLGEARITRVFENYTAFSYSHGFYHRTRSLRGRSRRRPRRNMGRRRLVQRVRRGMAADGGLQGLTTGVQTPSADPPRLVMCGGYSTGHHEEGGECRGVETQLVQPAMEAYRYPRARTRRAPMLHGEGQRRRAGLGDRGGRAEHGRGVEV